MRIRTGVVKNLLEKSNRSVKYEVIKYKNKFYVILDKNHTLIEIEYETRDFNTEVAYALTREDARNLNLPRARTEPSMREVSIFDFIMDNLNFYEGFMEELEKQDKLKIMDKREFEDWAKERVYEKDYIVYDHRGRELSLDDFIETFKPEPIKNISDLKSRMSRRLICKDLNIKDVHPDFVNPKKIIDYAKSSEANYRDVQRLYVDLGDRDDISREEKDFWKKINRELKFPDKVRF